MSRSVTALQLFVALLFLTSVLATQHKRSIALGRLSLRPGKRNGYSSSPQAFGDVFKVVRLPTVVSQCSSAHMEAVADTLGNLILLMDRYSFYLEKCSDLGYSA